MLYTKMWISLRGLYSVYCISPLLPRQNGGPASLLPNLPLMASSTKFHLSIKFWSNLTVLPDPHPQGGFWILLNEHWARLSFNGNYISLKRNTTADK